jgi:hypothetical protein
VTDIQTGKEVVQKTVTYLENVSKESRKALTSEFNQDHKGVAMSAVSPLLRQSLLDWFSRRDQNLKITHESTSKGRLGEVRMVFQGETKKVRFKVHLHATFAVNGQSEDSPSFLREVNVFVDPREFSA